MEATVGDDELLVRRGIATLRSRAGLDVVFVAKVRPDRKSMRISHVNGGLTQSLVGLSITSGDGLGGKSLVLARPVQVRDYLAARGITHLYDHAVEQERLRTVAALPVQMHSSPRYVIYLGYRSRLDLDDRWFDHLMPTVRKLQYDLAVSAEVDRRLALLRPDRTLSQSELSTGDLLEIAAELTALANQVGDDQVRARLAALSARVSPPPPAPRSRAGLTPREIAVLREVARGCSNAAAAHALGLLPSTVKSYLKSAMRKLRAENRVQATLAAQALGVIR